MTHETLLGFPPDARWIADGSDSDVYRAEDKVVKVYRYTHKPLEAIQRYAQLTNRAADFLRREPFGVDLVQETTGSDPITGYYEVADIEQVGLSPEGLPTVVAPYISGPDLFDIGRGKLNIWLLDPREQVPLGGAVRAYLANRPRGLSPYYTQPLTPNIDDLTRYLKEGLDERHIHIEALNVKMRWDLENNRLRLVVTDLASFV